MQNNHNEMSIQKQKSYQTHETFSFVAVAMKLLHLIF